MATDIIKVDGKYRVFEQGSKSDLGEYDTRAEAEAKMAAVYLSSKKHNAGPTPCAQAGGGKRLNDSYEAVPISDVYVDGRKISTER